METFTHFRDQRRKLKRTVLLQLESLLWSLILFVEVVLSIYQIYNNQFYTRILYIIPSLHLVKNFLFYSCYTYC